MGTIRLMRYKVGDNVRIKTWEELEKEYNTWAAEAGHLFISEMEEELNKLNTNRVLTIKEIYNNIYRMKEISYVWTDEMIEHLVEEIFGSVINRFEILDIRDN